jgi:hypothetical protein
VENSEKTRKKHYKVMRPLFGKANRVIIDKNYHQKRLNFSRLLRNNAQTKILSPYG